MMSLEEMKLNREIIDVPKTIKNDLTGIVVKRLTVIGYLGKVKKRHWWLCKCECGNLKSVRAIDLSAKTTGSCGCLWLESNRSKGKNKTHGMNGTRLYKCWQGMKERCNNPNHNSYHRYGGRGISYTSRWETFERFLEDMGETYREGLTLDRIDNNGNYCKSNCKWSTPTEQVRNRETSIIVDFGGKTVSFMELFDEMHHPSVDYTRAYQRIFRDGWDIEKALTKPTGEYNMRSDD